MCHMGIAISKDHLDWAAVDASNREVVHEGHQPNTATGVRTRVKQLQSFRPVLIVLKATGTYHFPRLADLVAAQLPVAVVNPAQLKGDRQRQLGRTHTDRQDARLLARFGVARASESRLYAPPQSVPAPVERLDELSRPPDRGANAPRRSAPGQPLSRR